MIETDGAGSHEACFRPLAMGSSQARAASVGGIERSRSSFQRSPANSSSWSGSTVRHCCWSVWAHAAIQMFEESASMHTMVDKYCTFVQ